MNEQGTDEKLIPRRSLLDFERPRLDNALHLDNPVPHGFGFDPNDGVPRPVVSTTMKDSKAPKLSPDRFVCMAHEARPQCQHYVRQLIPSAHDPDRVVALRYCTAMRDEGGEMFDLRDQEVLACELRNPADAESARKLAVYDENIMRRQKEAEEEAKPFDPLAALAEQEGSDD